jgi:4-amino-4-deoxy-L-arabinose transferase-like glycosyltransferase
LAVIVAVGLAIRLVYIFGWWDPVQLGGDAVYYHVGANALADGHGFVHPIELAFRFRSIPGADHPPAYIVYLGLASKLGFRTVLAHQIWSALLGTATIAVVGLIGRRIGGARVGLIAAALAAVFPTMWMPDAWVLAETMAIFATCLVILAAYRCWDRPQPLSAGLLGIALGLAALSRSELLLLAPLIVLPLVWFRRSKANRPIAMLVVATLTTVATIAPWAVYNLSRFDEPVFLSNQLDRTMAASWCDEAFSGPLIGYKSYDCLRRADSGDTPAEMRSSSERAWKRYARNHMTRVPVVAAARVGRMWGVFRPIQQVDAETGLKRGEWPSTFVGLVMTWVLIIAGVVGARRLRLRGVALSPLVAPILAVSAVAALTFGQLRYRAPAEPAIVLLAAAAFARRPPKGDRQVPVA